MSKIALVIGLEETGKSEVLGVFKDKEIARKHLTKTFKEDKQKFADVFVVEGTKNKGYTKEQYVPDAISEFENTVEVLNLSRGIEGNNYTVVASGITATRAYLNGLLDNIKTLGKVTLTVEEDGTVVANTIQETGTTLDVVKLDIQMGKELIKARKKALQQDLGLEAADVEDDVEDDIADDVEEDVEEALADDVEDDIVEDDAEEDVVEEPEEEEIVEDDVEAEEAEEIIEDEEIEIIEDEDDVEVEEEIVDEDDDEDLPEIDIDDEELESIIDEL